MYSLKIGNEVIDYVYAEKRDSNSRGIIISKEFDYREVGQVHHIADSLEKYLQKQAIKYERKNIPRLRLSLIHI